MIWIGHTWRFNLNNPFFFSCWIKFRKMRTHIFRWIKFNSGTDFIGWKIPIDSILSLPLILTICWVLALKKKTDFTIHQNSRQTLRSKTYNLSIYRLHEVTLINALFGNYETPPNILNTQIKAKHPTNESYFGWLNSLFILFLFYSIQQKDRMKPQVAVFLK